MADIMWEELTIRDATQAIILYDPRSINASASRSDEAWSRLGQHKWIIRSTKCTIKWIDKSILAHTKYKYCYATVYDKECGMYGFNHHNFTNEQYYEKFNDAVDFVEAIGKIIQHRFLMEDTAHKTFIIFWWPYFR